MVIFEIYDFPGEYETRPGGEGWAKIRMEEEEAAHAIIYGEGNCNYLAAGYTFQIEGLEHAANGGYLLTSVSHHAHENAFHADSSDQQSEYVNSFTCIPDELQYRPPRVTPKPFVQGTQTATVVGPPGKEIHTDEHGRVKVHFHWDRRDNRDHNSSCWIRVSQPWAGQNWGAVSIPRIGQEVIVDFLEGDPDRPIITGRVYNADQIHPYGLPANHAVTGIKSRSTPGGGGYNEVMMDDSAGAELVRIHSQKDMQTRVENNEVISIGNSRLEDVAVNEIVAIGNNRSASVAVDETVAVGNNRVETVGNNKASTVTNQYSINCDTMVLTAGTSITLQCGASKIHMNQAGIINISGVIITTSAAAVANMVAPLTNVAGEIMANFTGGINVVSGAVTHVLGMSTTRIKAPTVKVNC